MHSWVSFSPALRVMFCRWPPLLSHFERQFGRQLDVLAQPQCVPVKHSRGHIRALFTALREEYCEELDAREMMLHSLLGALLVWLNRQCLPTSVAEESGTKAQRHASFLSPY